MDGGVWDAEKSPATDELTMCPKTEPYLARIFTGLQGAMIIRRSEVESFPDVWVPTITEEGQACGGELFR